MKNIRQLLLTLDSTLDFWWDDFLEDWRDPFWWVFLDSHSDGNEALVSEGDFIEFGPLTVMIHESSKSQSGFPESSLKLK